MIKILKPGVYCLWGSLFFLGINSYWLYMFWQLSGQTLSASPFDVRRIIELFIYAFMILTLLIWRQLRLELIAKWMGLSLFVRTCLILFFVAGSFSAIFSIYPKYGLLGVSQFMALFLACGVSATICVQLGRKATTFFLTLVTLAMISYAGYAAFSYSMMVNSPLLNYVSNPNQLLHYPNFINPRFLMHVFDWTLPLLIVPFLIVPKRWWYWPMALILSVTLIYLWNLSIASSSRSLALILIVVPIAMLGLFRKRALPWLALHLLYVCLGYLLFAVLSTLASTGGSFPALFHQINQSGFLHLLSAPKANAVTRLLESSLHSGRGYLWLFSLKLIAHHPLLGVGPLQFGVANEIYGASWLPTIYNIFDGMTTLPHNVWLNIATQWGLIAFACFTMLIVRGLIKWIKNCQIRERTKDNHIDMGLTAAVFTAFLHAQFSPVISTPASHICMIFVVGWLLGRYCLVEKSSVANISPWYEILLIAIVLMVGVGLGYGVFPDVFICKRCRVLIQALAISI